MHINSLISGLRDPPLVRITQIDSYHSLEHSIRDSLAFTSPYSTGQAHLNHSEIARSLSCCLSRSRCKGIGKDRCIS